MRLYGVNKEQFETLNRRLAADVQDLHRLFKSIDGSERLKDVSSMRGQQRMRQETRLLLNPMGLQYTDLCRRARDPDRVMSCNQPEAA